ncbi:MAG: prepilin peptidase [Alphaproteobacteria bacterium]
MALALTAFHVAIMVIAAAVFIAAALNDAWSYRIPNYMCGLLLALFPLFAATAPRGLDWHQNLAVFALVALSGFAMFLGNLAGAGDVKLLSAASLWAGPHLIAVLLVVTAIAGGVVSIVMAIVTHRRNREAVAEKEEEKVSLAKVPIPYGIAIATGGLAMLGMMAQPILLPG